MSRLPVSIHPRIQVALGSTGASGSHAQKSFNPSSDPSCPRLWCRARSPKDQEVSIHPRIQVALGKMFLSTSVTTLEFQSILGSKLPSAIYKRPSFETPQSFNPSSDPSCPRPRDENFIQHRDPSFNPSSDPSCPRPFPAEFMVHKETVSIHPRIQVALGRMVAISS